MPSFIDLTGRRFGCLTVIGRAEKENGAGAWWHCQCDCGAATTVKAGNLSSGSTKSCGCAAHRNSNLIGHRFGDRIVIEPGGRDKTGRRLWLCQCKCGKNAFVPQDTIKAGRSGRCRNCSADKKSQGSGIIYETRKKLSLTQKEFAQLLEVSKGAIGDTEREGRFFSDLAAGPAAQLRFNKAVPSEMKQQRHLYRERGKKRVSKQRVIVRNCTYCGKVVEQLAYGAESRKPFCNKSHAALYRCHGPMPLPSPAPFGSTVPVIIGKVDRIPKKRRANAGDARAITKVIKEAAHVATERVHHYQEDW